LRQWPAIGWVASSRKWSASARVGFIFPVGNMQGYLNFKGYKEFAAENRADGWEYVGYICDLAGTAHNERPADAQDH
jgi:hypothetical protein